MTAPARRTLAELFARFTLEPSLDDVFVEGSLDKDLLLSSLHKIGKSRAVYEVDTVDVPIALLAAHGLSSGNKQRVLVLARELAGLANEGAYLCLVDRDLDHWFGPLETTPRLRWTRYCSIELHFLSLDSIERLLILACKVRVSQANTFLDSLESVLSNMYAMRLAARELGWDLSWISFDKCLASNDSSIEIDGDEYITRLLNANGKIKNRPEFMDRFNHWLSTADGDVRLRARGHDFVDLLVWSVWKFKGLRELGSETAIQRLMVAIAGDLNELRNEVA